MTRVFHLVGEQGSGKTTVAVALAGQSARRGSVCMLKDALGGVSRFDLALGDFDYTGDQNPCTADYLFIEHYQLPADAKPGEVVIRLGRVGREAESSALPKFDGVQPVQAWVDVAEDLATLNAAMEEPGGWATLATQILDEVKALRRELARVERASRVAGELLSVDAPVPQVTFNFIGSNAPTVVSLSQAGRPGVVEVDKSLSERPVASVPEGLTPNGAPAQ